MGECIFMGHIPLDSVLWELSNEPKNMLIGEDWGMKRGGNMSNNQIWLSQWNDWIEYIANVDTQRQTN